MSSRHRARLAKAIDDLEKENPKEEEEEDEDEDEDDLPPPSTKKKMFVFDESDSDSDSDSDSNSNGDDNKDVPVVTEQKNLPPLPRPSKKAEKKAADDEDERALNEVLATRKSEQGGISMEEAVVVRSLLRVDVKHLDIDGIMRKRFGSASVRTGNNDDDAGQRRGVGQRKPNIHKLSNKRLIFGTPKDDWSRPPSFVGGGIGMQEYDPSDPSGDGTATAAVTGRHRYFKFVYSEEFHRLHEQFQAVADSGDVNRLAMFLSTHPYHPEGLLQLAMVFARTGSMDRAVDFVRRCLYCCEMSFVEAFKPASGDGVKMDPLLPQNGALFSALFRHMQMSAMLGCPSVSAEVAKILLSLSPRPSVDPYGVLLSLDYFLLSSGKYQELLCGFCGLSEEGGGSDAAWKVQLAGTADLTQFLGAWSSPLDLQETDTKAGAQTTAGADGSKQAAGGVSSGSQSSFRLSTLPNWWFALCLAAYNLGNLAGGNAQWEKRSRLMLQKTLSIWPYMLEPLMKKAGAQTGSSLWRPVFTHPFFAAAQGRLPPNSVLLHIGEIFVARSSSLWGRDEVHRWAASAARDLLVTLDGDADLLHRTMVLQTDTYDALSSSSGPGLERYRALLVEDFLEEYPRLPPEANPLDPRLADPAAFARPRRDREAGNGMQRGGGGGNRRVVLRGGQGQGMDMDMDIDPALLAALQGMGGDGEGGQVDVQELLHRLGPHLPEADRAAILQALVDLQGQEGAAGGMGGMGVGQGQGLADGNLDPNLPLMQLFLQTLLPWNDVRRNGNDDDEDDDDDDNDD